MRLVEDDDAAEILTHPFDQLAQPRAPVTAVGAQGGIGQEEDPIAQRDRGAELPLVEMLDVERQAAKRRPVAPRVFDQRLALGYPEVAAVAAQPLVEDDARHLPPLAGARAIAKEKARPIGIAGLCRQQRKPLLARYEPARRSRSNAAPA
jgi:hypothetical protein